MFHVMAMFMERCFALNTTCTIHFNRPDGGA